MWITIALILFWSWVTPLARPSNVQTQRQTFEHTNSLLYNSKYYLKKSNKSIITYVYPSYVFYDMHLNCTRSTDSEGRRLNKLKALTEVFTPLRRLRSRQSTDLCCRRLLARWCAVKRKITSNTRTNQIKTGDENVTWIRLILFGLFSFATKQSHLAST